MSEESTEIELHEDEGPQEPYSGGYGDYLVPDPFTIPEQPEKMPHAPRAVHAFELRKAGVSYEEIAKKLGYRNAESVRATIHSRIARHYKASQKDVEEIMGLELERLDALQLLCWKAAQEGDLGAVDKILKIMERRAKLMGLDVQTDTQGNTTVNQTAVVVAGSKSEFLDGIRQAAELMKAQGE